MNFQEAAYSVGKAGMAVMTTSTGGFARHEDAVRETIRLLGETEAFLEVGLVERVEKELIYKAKKGQEGLRDAIHCYEAGEKLTLSEEEFLELLATLTWIAHLFSQIDLELSRRMEAKRLGRQTSGLFEPMQ